MTTPTRRVLLMTLSLVLAATFAACDGVAATPPPSAAPTADASAAPTPVVSVSPMEPGTSSAPPASQTDTDWGRIWDAVPVGFPRYPGGTTADDATPGPVSAAYVIPSADAATIADWMQTTLETATYSTEALSGPLEDGSFVLDSVGDADCRIETRIAPLGEMTLVTVLYGAACPA